MLLKPKGLSGIVVTAKKQVQVRVGEKQIHTFNTYLFDVYLVS